MHLRERIGVVLVLFAGISLLMILLLATPLGGEGPLSVRNFVPLVGAFVGGVLVLICINSIHRQRSNGEMWFKNEKLAWNLMGLGLIAWFIGEAIWRYYRAVGLTPFPSWADLGYSSYPPLVFVGLILLPSSQSLQKRTFLILDSLISVGALLSIAWFFLLGSLAQTPNESLLAKTLGLYYPITDAILLSSVIFLLLRGSSQLSSAHRISLLVLGIGLLILTASDFNFNVQSNLNAYMEGTWADLGWPLGMMTIGLAAYLRRFWPTTNVQQQQQDLSSKQLKFGFAQAVPYLLLVTLFILLVLNILSKDPIQASIRTVLVIATMIVLGLVLVRQLLTMQENARLVQGQGKMIQEMETINQSIAEHNTLLETGITHLKDTQTRLANGDVRARAYIANGELWPLAHGLNLMADRMMRSDRGQKDAQSIAKAISEFSQALERVKNGNSLILPASCLHIPEMHRLFLALGLKAETEPIHFVPPQPGLPPLSPFQNTATSFSSRRPPSTLSGKLGKSSLEHQQNPFGTT